MAFACLGDVRTLGCTRIQSMNFTSVTRLVWSKGECDEMKCLGEIGIPYTGRRGAVVKMQEDSGVKNACLKIKTSTHRTDTAPRSRVTTCGTVGDAALRWPFPSPRYDSRRRDSRAYAAHPVATGTLYVALARRVLFRTKPWQVKQLKLICRHRYNFEVDYCT